MCQILKDDVPEDEKVQKELKNWQSALVVSADKVLIIGETRKVRKAWRTQKLLNLLDKSRKWKLNTCKELKI